MSDQGFDACECIWSHELAMQRLLSILRQTQGYCTDTECLSISRLPGPRQETEMNPDVFFALVMMGMIALLYALRPKSLRQSNTEDVNKTNGNGPDSSGEPPMPPPTVN